MAQYSQFIYLVREKCRKLGDIETAINEAIHECVTNNILKDFLQKNGGDVVSFLFEALTKEEMVELDREDGYEEGLAKGEASFAALSEKLLDANRIEDLRKGMSIQAFCLHTYM